MPGRQALEDALKELGVSGDTWEEVVEELIERVKEHDRDTEQHESYADQNANKDD